MKKTIVILVLLSLLLGMLVGCGSNDGLDEADLRGIVLKHAAAQESDISDFHVHIEENDDGAACFSVHVTVKGKTYTYLIHGTTGEILSVTEGSSH